jgi:hypothetical protein
MKLSFANRDSGADRCAFDPDQLNATVGARAFRQHLRNPAYHHRIPFIDQPTLF